jgi:hypothetical protein
MNNHHRYLIGRNTRKILCTEKRRAEREEEEMGLCRDFILAAHRPMLHGISSLRVDWTFKPNNNDTGRPLGFVNTDENCTFEGSTEFFLVGPSSKEPPERIELQGFKLN